MNKCLICNKEYNSLNSLSRHISTHMSQQAYYNLYLKKDINEGKCLICGKDTRFDSIRYGYSKCCSRSCRNIWINQNRTKEQRLLINQHLKEAANSPITKEKRKQTNLEKYGVEHVLQSSLIREQIKNTIRERYGVDYITQSNLFKEKSNNTKFERYGSSTFTNPQKRINTCQEKYGVDNVFQAECVKNKIKAKLYDKYGVFYSFQATEVKQKIQNTKLKRYNNKNYVNADKISKTSLIRFGKSNYFGSNKAKQDSLLKFGTEYPIQSTIIQNKRTITYRKNHSFKSSKQEELFYNRLLAIFDKDDINIHYKDSRYPFICDFYIISKDIFIELNLHWTHNYHFFDKDDIEDKMRLSELNKKALTSKYYQNAIDVWTIRDSIKFEYGKTLNYVALFTKEDIDTWFSLNCPVYYIGGK